ncbi:MAG: ROK family protein [Hyphomicrobiales bacterium]|nr:ROK family protein [Hyphomicrobiales bacterium]
MADVNESSTGTPLTLAIDIGGSHLKASVLDQAGGMHGEPVRVQTPDPASPEATIEALVKLVEPLGHFDRVSIGFPGVVRAGSIFTAPTLRDKHWDGFDLAGALARAWKRPIRILNDASVQGLGVISGQGLECVITLGTGFGFALFEDGRVAPHFELSQHPIRKEKSYNEYVGHAALEEVGKSHWNKRMKKVIQTLATVINYDVLYIGGGNARLIKLPLSSNVKIVPNAAGITGGIRLWDERWGKAFLGKSPPFHEAAPQSDEQESA